MQPTPAGNTSSVRYWMTRQSPSKTCRRWTRCGTPSAKNRLKNRSDLMLPTRCLAWPSHTVPCTYVWVQRIYYCAQWTVYSAYTITV